MRAGIRKLWLYVSPCERVQFQLTLREARTPTPELRNDKRVRQMLARLDPEAVRMALVEMGEIPADHNWNLMAILRLASQDIFDRSRGCEA